MFHFVENTSSKEKLTKIICRFVQERVVEMKIVKENLRYNYQIKVGNTYVTVATLTPWIANCNKYELYFNYYGEEYENGLHACNHKNGNEGITCAQKENEYFDDFLKRINKIVLQKLYVIGNSIMKEIRYIE